MKIVFDTNIVLDLLLDREPFSESATKLFSSVELKEMEGFLCATTITTIYYLYVKAKGRKEAQKKIKLLLSIFEVANVNKEILESALTSKITDYEDAVIEKASIHTEVQGIVTRNLKDFKYSKIKVYSPIELLNILSLKKHN